MHSFAILVGLGTSKQKAEFTQSSKLNDIDCAWIRDRDIGAG
jgi:hypothetical protein